MGAETKKGEKKTKKKEKSEQILKDKNAIVKRKKQKSKDETVDVTVGRELREEHKSQAAFYEARRQGEQAVKAHQVYHSFSFAIQLQIHPKFYSRK